MKRKNNEEKSLKYEKPTVVAFDVDSAICQATGSLPPIGGGGDPWEDEASDDTSIHGLSDDNMKTVFD